MMPCRAGWKMPMRCCAAVSVSTARRSMCGRARCSTCAPPSRAWAEALHGFAWLPPLAVAGGEAARTLATNLISQWLKRNARYSEPAWSPHVMARRLMHIFCHGRLVIANSDMLWRSQAVRRPARAVAHAGAHRRRSAGWPAAPGSRGGAGAVRRLPGRLPSAAGRRAWRGSKIEIARQILPDGGHINRSPEDRCCMPIAI